MSAYEIGQRVRTTINVAGATPAKTLPVGTLGTITELLNPDLGGGYGVVPDNRLSGIPLAYDQDELEAVDA